MKYIIVKTEDDVEHGILFPDSISHKHVARMHRATDTRVVSAGFCDLKTMCAYGESETLRIKSRLEDSIILRAEFL